MKTKLYILIFLTIITLIFTGTVHSIESGDKLYLHYYRFDQNYSNWDFWVWENEPDSGEGMAFSMEDDNTSVAHNFGGKVAVIDFDPNFLSATKLGLIVRKSDWSQKDIDADRFITIPNTQGDKHFYFVEGDTLIGTSLNDINGPSKTAKIKKASFVSSSEIKFEGTENIDLVSTKIYIDNVLLASEGYTLKLDTDDAKIGYITLTDDMSFDHSYAIETKFASNNESTKVDVSYDGLFDTDEFNDSFGYTGALGAIYSPISTNFKLWAPLSSKVVLNIYTTGTPLNLGGNDTKTSHEMLKAYKGIYEITVTGDLHGYYYTYDVTNNGITNQHIVDPYAKSVGINGLRGMIVDFSKTNPEGWFYNNLPKNMTNQTDAIIYELHVRDLTTHDSWNGSAVNRGKYLGLVESGTKHNGLTTGFDHIKELGITHLQILPFFDYGNAIDETKQDDPEYNSFNWGYMPLNFNALEGNYSSDPYDGISRIKEFKQVVQTYLENDIRINMDVVYNHTGESANSNFNLIVPGYYHRLLDNGSYSNGSGTGNETASERIMVSKFIVDSVQFWAQEYNLGGFRFDLMALHDVDTMTEVARTLHDIDPTIMIYGEPWTGGTTTLDASQQAGKTNLLNIDGVGAFNDDFRDAIKGSVFSSWMGGFIQGDFTGLNKVKYGIVGGTNHVDNPGYNVWHGSPNKTINYVTAHDNNTLYDKLYLSLIEKNELDLIPSLALQANGLVLTSQGIAFLHAGDEFLRSKEISEGKFDHNSYQSPDNINQINWNLKSKNLNYYNQFKNLISIRNTYDELRYSSADLINDNVRFVFTKTKGVISYIIKNETENRTLLVVLNANNKKDFKTNLPAGQWTVLNDTSKTFNDTNQNLSVSGEIHINSNSFYVFKLDETLSPVDFSDLQEISNMNFLWWLIPSLVVVLSLSVGSVYYIKRKAKS